MKRRRAVDLEAVRAGRANLRWLARAHPELTAPPSEANRRGWETELEEAMAEDAKDVQLVVRLPKSLLDRLDAHAERLRREMPGPSWKRSDVVRLLLTKALEEVEPKRGKR
jgi:hypothetical protein